MKWEQQRHSKDMAENIIDHNKLPLAKQLTQFNKRFQEITVAEPTKHCKGNDRTSKSIRSDNAATFFPRLIKSNLLVVTDNIYACEDLNDTNGAIINYKARQEKIHIVIYNIHIKAKE